MSNKLSQLAQSGSNGASTLPGAPVTQATESQLIKQKIMAIVSSMETQDAERDHQKELLEQIEANHGIKKKVARKVAKLVHKKNKQEVDEENSAVENLHERLFKQS